MKFTNEFVVPSDIETTFATLTDLEKVAPCLPGASLTEIDGEDHHGQVKVKVGPMQLTYKGTARLVEADGAAKRGVITATGRETRGSGTARADVTAQLAEDANGTRVTVETELNITGKPAQFGRGVMEQVGSKIIDQFAARLSDMLADDHGKRGEADSPADGTVGAAAATSGDPRDVTNDDNESVLDLVGVARGAVLRRAVPLLIGLVVVIGLVWWLAAR